MPRADIILCAKPPSPIYLEKLDYPLKIFENFSQASGILMQFELVADKILIFWQSMADLERTFDFLNSRPLGEFSDYIPTGDLIPWEVTLISYSGGDKDELLRYLADKISEFLKNYQKVNQHNGKMIFYLPEDFTFDKYLAGKDITS